MLGRFVTQLVRISRTPCLRQPENPGRVTVRESGRRKLRWSAVCPGRQVRNDAGRTAATSEETAQNRWHYTLLSPTRRSAFKSARSINVEHVALQTDGSRLDVIASTFTRRRATRPTSAAGRRGGSSRLHAWRMLYRRARKRAGLASHAEESTERRADLTLKASEPLQTDYARLSGPPSSILIKIA